MIFLNFWQKKQVAGAFWNAVIPIFVLKKV
jgi:hypothetical protein